MEKTKVIVGLGSCGVAAGAGKVYDKIKALQESENLDFELKKTSCVGMCYREPLVEIVDEIGYVPVRRDQRGKSRGTDRQACEPAQPCARLPGAIRPVRDFRQIVHGIAGEDRAAQLRLHRPGKYHGVRSAQRL
jgi:hypothetical protein